MDFSSPRLLQRKGVLMVKEAKLQQLEGQLSRDGLGLVGEMTTEALHVAVSITSQLVASLRRAASDQPLTVLILSFQAGYAVGHWEHRHAAR